MQQPEKFICISYSQVDFLIPNAYVSSSVGVKDLNLSLLRDQDSGIFDFDEIASQFIQIPREADIKTMIALKDDGLNHISIVTTQECKVCSVSLDEFGLFSDFILNSSRNLAFLPAALKRTGLES